MPASPRRSPLPRRAATRCATLLVVALSSTGCGPGGDDAPATTRATAAATGGTVVIATPTEPDHVIPPVVSSVLGRQIDDLLFERLADIGPALNTVGDAGFTPRLATRWTWSADSLSIAFSLDPAARWHDGRPVRAADVAFTYALYKDPAVASPAAALLGNVDSVTVRDSLTAVAWFARRAPEQFYDATHHVVILPAHLLAAADRARLAAAPFAKRPVGSGPFRFDAWTPGERLVLVADTTGGRRRATLDRVVWTFAKDPTTAFTRVATGEADIYENVRPDRVAEVARNAALRLDVAPGLDYHYVAFNLHRDAGADAHPVFGDRAVRRALTMALDRAAIVRVMFDTLARVALGPFPRAVATADTAIVPLPHAPDSAARLLDAAGWVRGADGMRAKGGVPLAFSILVPSVAASRVKAATVMQAQWRAVGVRVGIEQVDFPAFLARLDARRFEAIIGGWSADPGAGAVRQTWGRAGARAGGENAGRYVSAAFDAHVDSGLATFDRGVQRAHFAAAWRTIVDDAPGIWLSEPWRLVAMHRRLRPVGMRPDAWWARLHEWTIAPDQRLPRDGAGTLAAR